MRDCSYYILVTSMGYVHVYRIPESTVFGALSPFFKSTIYTIPIRLLPHSVITFVTVIVKLERYSLAKMIFASILLLLICEGVWNVEIDSSKTIIWGPGLEPDKITMRARYIFLQFADFDGKNLTESPGKDVISASVEGRTLMGHKCRVWTQIFDCKDGTFIVRYKIHDTCFDLKLNIKTKHRGSSVLSTESEGPVYEEECYCPNPSIDDWLDDFKCPKNYAQIYKDLMPFTSVDFDKIRDDIVKAYDRPGSVSLCHYVVQSNKVTVAGVILESI